MSRHALPTEAETVFKLLTWLFLNAIKDWKTSGAGLDHTTLSIHHSPIPPPCLSPLHYFSMRPRCPLPNCSSLVWIFAAYHLIWSSSSMLSSHFISLSPVWHHPPFSHPLVTSLLPPQPSACMHSCKRPPKLTGSKGRRARKEKRKTWTVWSIWHTLNYILRWIICFEPRGVIRAAWIQSVHTQCTPSRHMRPSWNIHRPISRLKIAEEVHYLVVFRTGRTHWHKDSIQAWQFFALLCNSRSAPAICGHRHPWPPPLQPFILVLWKRRLPLALVKMYRRHNGALSVTMHWRSFTGLVTSSVISVVISAGFKMHQGIFSKLSQFDSRASYCSTHIPLTYLRSKLAKLQKIDAYGLWWPRMGLPAAI